MISQDHLDMMKLMNLEYPFNDNTLKSKFRDLCMEFHPDIPENRTSDNLEKMKNLTTAYNELKKIAVKDDISDNDVDRKIAEAKVPNPDDRGKIFEICSECSGSGKVIREKEVENAFPVESFFKCPKCGGTKKVSIPCKYCNNGTFLTKSGREVPCKACKGTGVWREENCPICNNEPYSFSWFYWNFILHKLRFSKEYVKYPALCPICHGKGKIEKILFNPLFPQGINLSPMR